MDFKIFQYFAKLTLLWIAALGIYLIPLIINHAVIQNFVLLTN